MITEEKSKLSLRELLKKDGTPENPIRVCFVCTGNTCRSPMAAAVLNAKGKGCYRAFSAGLNAMEGDPISQDAVEALRKAGILSVPENDYQNHKAHQLTDKDAENCDRIVAMADSHFLPLLFRFPEYAEKITVMPQSIPDPFMRGAEEYCRCLDAIEKGISELFVI